MKYNEKQLEILEDVPFDLNTDMLTAVRYLHQKNEIPLAEFLDRSRIDMLTYFESQNILNGIIPDNELGALAYETDYKKMEEINNYNDNETKFWKRHQYEQDILYMEKKLNNYEHKVFNLFPDKKEKEIQPTKVFYTLEQRIKYYKGRVKPSKHITEGQAMYARNYLERLGLRYE